MSLNDASSISLSTLELILLLFADDLALLDSTPRGLQKKLRILSKYCNENKLEVNVSKTKI